MGKWTCICYEKSYSPKSYEKGLLFNRKGTIFFRAITLISICGGGQESK